MDESIWRLPGPDLLISQVTQEVVRGRHVAVVLPAVRAREEAFVDGLIGTLMHTLSVAGEEPRVAGQFVAGSNLVRVLAECLVFGDELPVVVADLLDHEDAAGRTAILDCTGFGPGESADMANLLSRIAAESRPRSAPRRPRFVAVGTRQILPSLGAGSIDLTFDAVWWWGRLTRWDVASRLSTRMEPTDGREILRDLRLETILEVCRWDLDLAEQLAHGWDGDTDGLTAAIRDTAPAPAVHEDLQPAGAASGTRPADGYAADLWDAGRIEQWHYESSPGPRELIRLDGSVERAVWTAQARILLPWIEVRRQRLLDLLLATFGAEAVAAAAARMSNGNGSLEFGPLHFVTRELTSRTDAALREAARQLRDTRNKLAHLASLTLADQTRLLDACCVLNI